MADVPDFSFTELLPLGADDTEYRLVTTEGVSSVEPPEGPFLTVEPEAIRKLSAEAMHGIAHFLRSGPLQPVRHFLDDPEAAMCLAGPSGHGGRQSGRSLGAR